MTAGERGNHRHQLLEGLRRFVVAVERIPGVRAIVLLGFITTATPDPKDIDVLLVVDDDADLAALATAFRCLQGHTQSCNCGAESSSPTHAAFTSGEHAIGETVGRACAWPETRGIVALEG